LERVSFFDPVCCFFKCYLLLEVPLSGKKDSNILILLRLQPKPHQQVLEHPGRQPSDPAVAGLSPSRRPVPRSSGATTRPRGSCGGIWLRDVQAWVQSTQVVN
jgi:hypothetical protein